MKVSKLNVSFLNVIMFQTGTRHYVWLRMRYIALPQGAIPIGESTIPIMWGDSRKLVHTHLIRPSDVYCRRGANRGIALSGITLWRG